MSKSSGIVVARVVLAVVLLSLIFSCVYYFIIKARNEAEVADNPIFATYNTMMSADNVVDVAKNLGDLESGEYYSYAVAHNVHGYRETFLSLYCSQQLLDANAYRLILAKGDTAPLVRALESVTDNAQVLMRSIIVYNTSKQAYGNAPTTEQAAALLENFGMIVKDMVQYSAAMASMAQEVFLLTSQSYFGTVNAFDSAQYLYSFSLQQQMMVLDREIGNNLGNISDTLYDETRQIVQQFVSVSEAHFLAQTTCASVANVLGYYSQGAEFDDFLSSPSKVAYVQAMVDATQKAQCTQYLAVLGLSEEEN